MFGNSTENIALNATTDIYNDLFGGTTNTSYHDMFNGTTKTSYHGMFNGTTNTSYHDIINETTNTSYSANMTTTTEYGYHSTTEQPDSHKDLIWILPAVLGIVCFLVGVACVLFYTIKYCEICILRFLYKYCGCCSPPTAKRQKTRQSYTELQEREDITDEIDAMYMKDCIHTPSIYYTTHWGKADDRNCIHGHPKMSDEKLDVIESAGSFGTIDRLDDDELFSQEKEKS